MRNLVAFPLLLTLMVTQTAVLGRLRLLSGSADILLVWLAAWSLQKQVDSGPHWALLAAAMTGFVTHLPIYPILFGYLAVVVIAKLLSRRVWQAPLLAMFGVSVLGTLVMHVATVAMLALAGTSLPIGQVIGQVTLPSVILNLLFAIPLFYWSRDLAGWVYPGVEVV